MRIPVILSCLLLMPASLVASAAEGPIASIGPHDNQAALTDLHVLGEAMGVFSEAFDYAAKQPHCIHFTVEIAEDGLAPKQMVAGAHCGLAGPHRITIQWRDKGEQMRLYFYGAHKDANGYVGGFEGPTFDKPPALNHSSSTPLAKLVAFEADQPVVLSRRQFTALSASDTVKQSSTLSAVSATITVRLRDNPESTIGSH